MCGLVLECITFQVEQKVTEFGHELEVLFYLNNHLESILHLQYKCTLIMRIASLSLCAGVGEV